MTEVVGEVESGSCGVSDDGLWYVSFEVGRLEGAGDESSSSASSWRRTESVSDSASISASAVMVVLGLRGGDVAAVSETFWRDF